MKEQLRTEAEKVLKQAYDKNVKPLMSNMPTFEESNSLGGYDWIINTMLDFHAQQSKERDALIDAKETIEHAIKTIERLLSGKPIKNLDEILADYKRISKSL